MPESEIDDTRWFSLANDLKAVMDLTTRQEQALAAAFKQGGAWYGKRGNLMGGAYLRLCHRLAALGLVNEDAPYAITVTGLIVLRNLRAQRFAKRSCMAYQDDLRDVEAALAKFPRAAQQAAEMHAR